MADWRFTIINRDNISTVVEEPVGWDKNVSEINRNLDWHGIFFANQGQTFEFYGIAHDILKAEYDQYGHAGIATLLLEENCGNGYEEFDRAKFVFSKYRRLCGSGSCFVRIPAETTSDVMDLRNRLNQKVNLETEVAFDETTPLAPYGALPFNMFLPSKGIFIQNRAEAIADSIESFDGGLQAPSGPTNITDSQIQFGLPDNQLSEIGNFVIGPTHTMDMIAPGVGFAYAPSGVFPLNNLYPLNLSPFENYSEGSSNYGDISNPVAFDFRIKGDLDVLETYLGTTSIYLLRLPNRPTLSTNGENLVDYEVMGELNVYNSGSGVFPGGYLAPNSGALPFDFVFTGDVTINEGDRFYLFMALTERKTATEITNVDAGAKALRLTLDTDSHIRMTNLSHTPPTESKVFAVNETISRIAEAITNDRVRAYSEYFGRTDSEPYSHDADGCGSLEVLTDGIRIRRQENKIPGKVNLFSLSLQDVFEGLNAIHNIGIGLEADPNREGYSRLRTESWEHFYNDTVIMNCTDIAQISRDANDKEVFSTYQFGYDKWEAEEFNGLDEFLTKRIYRTTLNQIKNDLIKISKFVASGYALEITRRKGNNDSKDWRYDKNVFIVCVTREIKLHVVFDNEYGNKIIVYLNGNSYPTLPGTLDITGTSLNDGTYTISGTVIEVDGDSYILTFTVVEAVTYEENYSTEITNISWFDRLSVELGNVTSPANIIDPNTLYNYRISPIRNAMRWINRVFESYKQFGVDCKILFTDGDGNYFAEGEMTKTDCKPEAGVIAENQTIDVSAFDDSDRAKPFLSPERIVYDYPMTSQEFKTVSANPYGLIHFENECENGDGWIDSIKYRPEEGKATFNLIPKTV